MKKFIFSMIVLLMLTGTVFAKVVKLGRGKGFSLAGISSVAVSSELVTGIDCADHCQTCDTTTGSCTLCKSSHYILRGVCALCPSESYCNGIDSRLNCTDVVCKAGKVAISQSDQCCCS